MNTATTESLKCPECRICLINIHDTGLQLLLENPGLSEITDRLVEMFARVPSRDRDNFIEQGALVYGSD